MNYHISTTLIWDNFKKDCECPICAIKREVELRILDQFQGEAVMIDDFRDRVNKNGFCREHSNLLLKAENKLGTALQMHTRLKNISKALDISTLKNSKKLTSHTSSIYTMLSTCAVCDLIDSSMERYYKTVAELYHNDLEFKKLLESSKGFCLFHYAKLMDNSNHAKSSQAEYVKLLNQNQKQAHERLLAELDWFCDKFDYRNKDKPIGTSKDALPRAINKIHGE